jgi:hypothetical protein
MIETFRLDINNTLFASGHLPDFLHKHLSPIVVSMILFSMVREIFPASFRNFYGG